MLELVKIREDIAWIIEQIKCLLSRSLAATAWSENHTSETGGSYTIDTLVWYNKCIYRCKRNNNSVIPTDTVYWSDMGPGMLLEETIPDWLASKNKRSYIKNKPTKTSDFFNDGEDGMNPFVTEAENGDVIRTVEPFTKENAIIIVDGEGRQIKQSLVTISDLGSIDIPLGEDYTIGGLPINGDKTFTFIQGVPSLIWNIPHFLNKIPSVTIMDNTGTEYEGDITHTDTNNLIITYSQPFSGKAVLN